MQRKKTVIHAWVLQRQILTMGRYTNPASFTIYLFLPFRPVSSLGSAVSSLSEAPAAIAFWPKNATVGSLICKVNVKFKVEENWSTSHTLVPSHANESVWQVGKGAYVPNELCHLWITTYTIQYSPNKNTAKKQEHFCLATCKTGNVSHSLKLFSNLHCY